MTELLPVYLVLAMLAVFSISPACGIVEYVKWKRNKKRKLVQK